jgi:hypothetical protein
MIMDKPELIGAICITQMNIKCAKGFGAMFVVFNAPLFGGNFVKRWVLQIDFHRTLHFYRG